MSKSVMGALDKGSVQKRSEDMERKKAMKGKGKDPVLIPGLDTPLQVSGDAVAKETKEIKKLKEHATEKMEWGRKSKIIARCRYLMKRYRLSYTPAPHLRMALTELEAALEQLEMDSNIISSRGEMKKVLMGVLAIVEAICKPGDFGIPGLKELKADGLQRRIVQDEEFPDLVDEFAAEYGSAFRNVGPMTRLGSKIGFDLLYSKCILQDPKLRAVMNQEGLEAATKKYNV